MSRPRVHVVEDLVARHQASVRGFLVYLGCPASQVDDLVQDVFLSVLSAKFEDRGHASTAAFLRTVARNLFLKAMRRDGRRPVLGDPALVEEAWVEFESDDQGQSYVAALRECLRAVRGRAQEVLDLRYHAGLRRAAIADRLGLSEAGVKSILVRTRKMLRGCIERRLA
jgi:RNA polymerase sigma factor (sigma-70 family)